MRKSAWSSPKPPTPKLPMRRPGRDRSTWRDPALVARHLVAGGERAADSGDETVSFLARTRQRLIADATPCPVVLVEVQFRTGARAPAEIPRRRKSPRRAPPVRVRQARGTRSASSPVAPRRAAGSKGAIDWPASLPSDIPIHLSPWSRASRTRANTEMRTRLFLCMQVQRKRNPRPASWRTSPAGGVDSPWLPRRAPTTRA